MLLDYLGLSWESIKNRKLRSWLTILGIVIGVTAIVTLISIGQGVQDSVVAEFEKLGYNTITIFPGGRGTPQGGMAGGGDSDLNPALVNQVEGVKVSGALRTETGLINSEGLEGQAFLRVTGFTKTVKTTFGGYFDGFPLAEGDMLSFEENQEVILGSEAAKDLGVTSGGTIQIEGRDFTVAGILTSGKDSDGGFAFGRNLDNSLFVSFATMEGLYEGEGRASTVLVEVYEDADVKVVTEEIEDLYTKHDIAVTTITTADISEGVDNVLNTIQIALAGIAAISLLVGGIGVMNTMYTAVLERTREIGVMKAVGARNGQVLGLFLIESGLLGLVGGLIGTLAGMGISLLAGRFIDQALATSFSPSFGPALLLGAVAFSFVLGSLSGIFPARQASQLQPVEALRYE